MLFVVYILFSIKFPRTYVGYTNNLERRIKSHNKGEVEATKSNRPWKVIYKEFVPSQQEAKKREFYWKSGAGRRNIKRILCGFPPRFRETR